MMRVEIRGRKMVVYHDSNVYKVDAPLIFDAILSAVREPYLFEGNFPELEEREGDGKRIYLLHDYERIKRIVSVLKDKRFNIYRLFGYGVWEPYDELNSIAEMRGSKLRYVCYKMSETIILYDVIDFDILKDTENDDFVSLRKVNKFGSLIYPLFKGKVSSVHGWIFYSLDEVVRELYRTSLKSHLQVSQDMDNLREMGIGFPVDFAVVKHLYVAPLHLLGLYLKDNPSSVVDYWRRVISVTEEEMKKIDLPDEDYKSAGVFNSDVRDFFNSVRKYMDKLATHESSNSLYIFT